MIIRNNEWKPSYLNLIKFAPRHKVSAEEWNALFNLSRTQGNNNTRAIEYLLAECKKIWNRMSEVCDWNIMQNKPFGEDVIEEVIYEGNIDYTLYSDGTSSGQLILEEPLNNKVCTFILDGLEYVCEQQKNMSPRSDNSLRTIVFYGNPALSPHVNDGNTWMFSWEDNEFPFYYESSSDFDTEGIFIIKEGTTRSYPLVIKSETAVINQLDEKYIPALYLLLTGGKLTGNLSIGDDIMLWASSGKISGKSYNLEKIAGNGSVPVIARGDADEVIVGNSGVPLMFNGSDQRPKYNATELVLLSELIRDYFPLSGGNITGNTKVGDDIHLNASNGVVTGNKYYLKTNAGTRAASVVERGDNDEVIYGTSSYPTEFKGKETHPKYNSSQLVLESDITSHLEEWKLTLADGSTITKKVYVG